MAPRPRVHISPREFDAITRMAYAEAKTMRDPRRYTSVVDAIINREAHRNDRFFGKETEEILNKHRFDKRTGKITYQFSPVGKVPATDADGRPLPKTWERLAEAPYDVQMEILAHLAQQSAGALEQSVPGRPTHYLNKDVPEAAYAKGTWADETGNWELVGERPRAHWFTVRDGTPPDAELELDPELMGRLRTHFPERYQALPPSGDVAPASSRSLIASPPVRTPVQGPWMKKLINGSVVGETPDTSRFDPRYPQTAIKMGLGRWRD